MPKLSNPTTKYIAEPYTNSDLNQMIPPIQYAYLKVTGGAGASGQINQTVTINNYNNLANYFVLTNVYNTGNGSGATYGPQELPAALGQIFIYNKTSTAFSFYLNRTTGDDVDIYFMFTIIYYA